VVSFPHVPRDDVSLRGIVPHIWGVSVENFGNMACRR
jgi:hypothetical protein